MSSFTDDLIVKVLNNGKYRVEKSFKYYVGYEGSDDVIIIPKGFESDFFSVPLPFRFFFPQSQYKGNQASVLHDYGYFTQTRSRKEVDDIFLEAMAVLGVPLIKRRIMWAAVRSWGWIPWRNHAKRNLQKAKKVTVKAKNTKA